MPRPLSRPLLLLTGSEDLHADLGRVVERPFRLERVPDWAALKRVLALAPPTAVCFADATREGGGTALDEELRETAQGFPLVAIVACLRVASGGSDVLMTLRSWGVAEILDLDRDRSAAAVARRLQQVRGVWAQRLFRRALPRTLSVRGRALLEAAGDVAAQGGNVEALGEALGISRGTVTRWCGKAGVPEPRRMLSWIRLLVAAGGLEDPRRSIESVAGIAGFSSAASLKSTTKAFTAFSPTDLRRQGAFRVVARLARAEFRAAREAARRSKRYRNAWYG